VLQDEVRWAIEHLRKYPEPGKDGDGKEELAGALEDEEDGNTWVVVQREPQKDLLAFI
jgi:hypothetical protein